MILNVPTVVSLFLVAVGALLAAAGGIISAWNCMILWRTSNRSQFDLVTERSHLVTMIVAVLIGVRLLAWVNFYLMLKSYVPNLSVFGVMCTFGVTRIQPDLVLALQCLKPVLLLGLGYWWILALVDRKAKAPATVSLRLPLTVPLAGIAMLDCATEAVYVFSEKVGRPVTCCTQFLDTAAGTLTSNVGPFSALSVGQSGFSLIAFFLVNILVIVGAVYLSRRIRIVSQTMHTLQQYMLLVVGLANLFVSAWSWSVAVAPRVLQLPYHHCVYELLTDTLALGLAAAMCLAGNGCLLWPAALQLSQRRAPTPIAMVQRQLYMMCAILLTSEVMIVSIHLV